MGKIPYLAFLTAPPMIWWVTQKYWK
jgi:hypothetical protein